MTRRGLLRTARALGLLGALLSSAPGPAWSAEADAWLDGLYDRVAKDLAAGKPLVATAYVALCSNEQIDCGGHGLGDGDSLERNLYWATTGGFHGWLSRRGSGWRRVASERQQGDQLLREVWERTLEPAAPLRRRGVTRPFALVVVAHAWRGAAIDAALETYLADLHADAARTLTLPDGRRIDEGGAAHVVAWIGHDRFMDRPPFDFAALRARSGPATVPKGMMAFACATAPYLARPASAPTRVPLVLTTDLMFASSPAFDHAVRAFAQGASYEALRAAATAGYALEQDKPPGRCASLFTNPSRSGFPLPPPG